MIAALAAQEKHQTFETDRWMGPMHPMALIHCFPQGRVAGPGCWAVLGHLHPVAMDCPGMGCCSSWIELSISVGRLRSMHSKARLTKPSARNQEIGEMDA